MKVFKFSKRWAKPSSVNEVTGWVGKQISNMLHKALTMRNVFLIICSLLETCRFQSLGHSLAATGVSLAVIVQLDLLVFWMHYRPFKDSKQPATHGERCCLSSFLLQSAAEKTFINYLSNRTSSWRPALIGRSVLLPCSPTPPRFDKELLNTYYSLLSNTELWGLHFLTFSLM